jgi:D-glycero-D-manno-heptose 1,7-bisphosphate phosphatase
MAAGRSRALLLDRDGTLIRDVGYPRDPDAVVLLPGAAEALRHARELGYELAIVSNQSGVARGRILPNEVRDVQARVEQLFAEQGVTFGGAWFCFHAPDDRCGCRKPAPGLLVEAARALELDLARSIMIGDKASDIDAGLAAGCTGISFGEIRHPGAKAAFSSWPALLQWLCANS